MARTTTPLAPPLPCRLPAPNAPRPPWTPDPLEVDAEANQVRPYGPCSR